jgi:hypothetical protein
MAAAPPSKSGERLGRGGGIFDNFRSQKTLLIQPHRHDYCVPLRVNTNPRLSIAGVIATLILTGKTKQASGAMAETVSWHPRAFNATMSSPLLHPYSWLPRPVFSWIKISIPISRVHCGRCCGRFSIVDPKKPIPWIRIPARPLGNAGLEHKRSRRRRSWSSF